MQSTSLESNSKFSDLEYIKSHLDGEIFCYCDEVGRGPLAGPVVSSCVYLFPDGAGEQISFLKNINVTDSKKLNQKKRLAILDEMNIDLKTLKENKLYSINKYLGFAIASCNEKEIDEINILQASLLSMKRALSITYRGRSDLRAYALLDGNKVFHKKGFNKISSLIKGDLKSVFIALSSIIAKEYRDFLMDQMGDLYPGYGFEKHSGYPTKSHKEAIINLGVLDIHRKSFKGVREHCS